MDWCKKLVYKKIKLKVVVEGYIILDKDVLNKWCVIF